MGKIILCSGKETKNSYLFPLSRQPICSIEELCYYLYHNIYEIGAEIFDETLVEWIRKDIQMPVLADKLEKLIDGHSDIKDITVTIFCSCDYYDESAIKHMVQVMTDIEHLSYCGRQKIKADNLLRYGKYRKAIHEYQKILYGGMAVNLPPEDYGDLLNNLSIAYLHADAMEDAIRGFKEAFSRNNRRETLKHYFLTLLLTGQETSFRKEVVQMGLTEEQGEEFRMVYEEALLEAMQTEEYRKTKQQTMTNGDEWNRLLDSWLASAKNHYRDNLPVGAFT